MCGCTQDTTDVTGSCFGGAVLELKPLQVVPGAELMLDGVAEFFHFGGPPLELHRDRTP